MEYGHVPVKALLTPLLLVIAYSAAIISLPTVPAAYVWSLAEGHLIRDTVILAAVLLIAGLVISLPALTNDARRQALRGRFHARLAARGAWVHSVRFMLPSLYLALLLAAFSTYKQLVLPSAGFGLDANFAALDRLVFFGEDPWRITHWLVPAALGTWLIDMAYMLWFLPMMLIVLLSGMAPPKLQTRYLIAFALIWIICGTVLAYLLPAAGPCYFTAFHGGGEFSELTARLHMQDQALAGFGGLKALLGQEGLLSAYQGRNFILAGGISAMPSIHVALATLFACAAFAVHRRAGWCFACFALLIWFGSVHLGWHYAVDGLIGAAIAMAIWRLAGLWTTHVFGGDASSPAAAAALAGPARD